MLVWILVCVKLSYYLARYMPISLQKGKITVIKLQKLNKYNFIR